MEDRRKLANGKEIWVIKAGFPNNASKKNWSDYFFACTLKKYLNRAGVYTVIESRDEWENEGAADVVVALRGPEAYYPDRRDPDTIYIMWNLSHPDRVTVEEYNAYDLVCIGSAKEEYLEEICRKVQVPVRQLLICADMEIFHPARVEKEKKYDWVFVGNSRGIKRKSVVWALEHHIPLKIWGKGWDKLLPEHADAVMAENIPNYMLPELYWETKITLNDHYEDMTEHGFMNTRILEAMACGVPVLSDYVDIIEKLFGDSVLFYTNEEQFVEQAEKIQVDYPAIRERVEQMWQVLQEEYSFESRVEQLLTLREELQGENQGIFDMFYKKFEQLQSEADTLDYESWHDKYTTIKEAYMQLPWMAQRSEELLEDKKRIQFESCFPGLKERIKVAERQRRERTWKEQEQHLLDETAKKIKENDKLKERNQFLEEWKDRLVRERTELQEKLQRTYDEKSEINRKLQQTYSEKFDRGVEIKELKQINRELKKKIDGIKGCKTYRLARCIGFPVRMWRKLIRG